MKRDLIIAGNLKQGKEYVAKNKIQNPKYIIRVEDLWGFRPNEVKIHKVGTWHETLPLDILEELRLRSF